MSRILVVAADPDVRDFVVPVVEQSGHAVEVEATGKAALARLPDYSPQVVVVCFHLPDMNGVQLCRHLREVDPEIGLLALVDGSDEIDGVAALQEGADDYMVRPVRMAELQARVGALARRASRRRPDAGAESFVLDPAARRVWIHGVEIDLTKKEFDLLSVLHANRGRVMLRDRLVDELWESGWYRSPKALDILVSSLRRKIAAAANSSEFIQTVRGVGYRLELEVPSADGRGGRGSAIG